MITNYSGLKAAIADWLNREDLTSAVPDFIVLAEAQMQADIKHWRRTQRASLTANDRFIALPDDWHSTIRLTIDGDYKDLELMSAREMADRRYRDEAADTPRFYRVADQSIELYPSPAKDTTFILEYVEKIPTLSDSNTSNWVLDHAPDAYLYGSLIHSATYLADDQRIPLWAQMYQAAVSRLNREKGETSGSNLRLRVSGLGGGGHYR